MIAKLETTIFKILRFLLILLSLGLGVHFGFFAPRGTYTLEYAGIFGESYSSVIWFTLLLYVFYRAGLIMTKTRIRRSQISIVGSDIPAYQEYKIPAFSLSREVFLLVLFVSPFLIGAIWAQRSFEIRDAYFAISRVAADILILLAISFLLAETIEFRRSK